MLARGSCTIFCRYKYSTPKLHLFPFTPQLNTHRYFAARKKKTAKKEDSLEEYTLLKDLIQTHRQFYETGHPIISDPEYDKLYNELLAIEEKNPSYIDSNSPSQIVAPTPKEEITKKRHSLPMLGLQNTYNDEQLTKFENKIKREVTSKKLDNIPIEFITEMKYDGMAVSLIFENGKFSHALSRGDGLYGEDMTITFLHYIKNLPFVYENNQKELYVPLTSDIVEIRGEIVCSISEFNRSNEIRKEKNLKLFSSPRNLTTGTLGRIDFSEETDLSLDMICYSLQIYKPSKKTETVTVSKIEDLEQFVEWSPSQPETQWDCLQLIKSWGFPICPRAQQFSEMTDIFNYIHKYETKESQSKFPYTTDGAVVKVNSIKQQQQIGRVARSYKWSIAYKFPTEIFITKLLDIQFQIGRTG